MRQLSERAKLSLFNKICRGGGGGGTYLVVGTDTKLIFNILVALMSEKPFAVNVFIVAPGR